MTITSKGTPGDGAAECGSHSALLALPWYCINTHPGQADQAIRHINFQRFLTYYPVVRKPDKKPAKPGRAHKPKYTPLFPNYLFVTFDVTKDFWHPLMFTHGVKYLFRHASGLPARISPADMSMIYQHADDPSDKQRIERVKLLKKRDLKGEVVTIVKHQALAGQRAIVDWSTDERVRVLMTILNRTVGVTVDRSQVSPVAQQTPP